MNVTEKTANFLRAVESAPRSALVDTAGHHVRTILAAEDKGLVIRAYRTDLDAYEWCITPEGMARLAAYDAAAPLRARRAAAKAAQTAADTIIGYGPIVAPEDVDSGETLRTMAATLGTSVEALRVFLSVENEGWPADAPLSEYAAESIMAAWRLEVCSQCGSAAYAVNADGFCDHCAIMPAPKPVRVTGPSQAPVGIIAPADRHESATVPQNVHPYAWAVQYANAKALRAVLLTMNYVNMNDVYDDDAPSWGLTPVNVVPDRVQGDAHNGVSNAIRALLYALFPAEQASRIDGIYLDFETLDAAVMYVLDDEVWSVEAAGRKYAELHFRYVNGETVSGLHADVEWMRGEFLSFLGVNSEDYVELPAWQRAAMDGRARSAISNMHTWYVNAYERGEV